jgi:hypothetical protein
MDCSHPKEQNLKLYPWFMVCVDLLASFLIRTPAKTDPATTWFEIVEATNKSATSIQDLFHNTLLERYPRLQFIVFDNGSVGEFKLEFKQMCVITIMALKPNQLQVTAIHPQGNAIID